MLAGILALPSTAFAAPRQQCHFKYQPLQAGDRAIETFHLSLDFKTVLLQDGQVMGIIDQTVDRDEHSTVLRLEAARGQSARAQISYDTSRQTVVHGRGGEATSANRPVAGKTYVVARAGEKLLITDPTGSSPPEEEQAMVARTMDALGKPNPFGVLLDGRTITFGEIVRLPADYTEKLLAGFDDSLAGMPVEVMLMGTEQVDGKVCSLLHTPPPGAGDSHAKRAPIDGKFLVELDTCRVAVIELRGPISATERRGAPGQEFDRRRKGKLQVSVHIQHERAAR